MFNWNTQMRGAGFPMQPQQMTFTGVQQQFPAAMPYQGAIPQQSWPQQQPSYSVMPPPALGMMMGQTWMPQVPGMFQHAGFTPESMAMAGFIGGMNPMPPAQPPKEVKPPLPAEPPPPLPSEKPPPPQAQPPGQGKSKWDLTSREQLQNNKPVAATGFMQPMLGAHYAAQGQPQPPCFPPPCQPEPPSAEPIASKLSSTVKTSTDPALLSELERIKREENIFLEQYQQWKKQYDDWREQNQNHPNKDQFQQYLQQWQTYEQQMEIRRKGIETQKQALEMQLSHFSGDHGSAGSTGDATKKPDNRMSEGRTSRWDNAGKESSSAPHGFPKPASDKEPSFGRNGDIGIKASFSVTNEKKFEGNQKPNQLGSGQSKGPNLTDEKGEEDMNLDEDDGQVGEIIDSREQDVHQQWGPSESSGYQAQGSNSWNIWNNEPEGPDQWSGPGHIFKPPDFQGGPRQGSNFHSGPRPRLDIQSGPRPGFNYKGGPLPGPSGPRQGSDFAGGPRPNSEYQGGPRLQGPSESFRGRGRGDWNMQGPRPRIGRGGQGMNEGPRFPGPDNENAEYQEGPPEDIEYSNTDYDYDNANPDGLFFDSPLGMDRGRGQRGRRDLHRGRGGDFHRGRGGEFHRGGLGPNFSMGRGGDSQRGRGRGEFPMGRGRGGPFIRSRDELISEGEHEFHHGRGGYYQRGRGGESLRGTSDNFSEGVDSTFLETDEVPVRGGFSFRGRGRLHPPPLRPHPPSLMDVNFNESMRERFPDFDPLGSTDPDEQITEQYGEEDSAFLENDFRDDDFRPMGRGRGFPIEGLEFEIGGPPHRGRGMIRGRGPIEQRRGLSRPRGGLSHEPPFVDDQLEEFNYGPQGRGRGQPGGGRGFGDRFFDSEDTLEESFGHRGRGRGSRGRGGFSEPLHNETFDEYSDVYENEGPPFVPRGRGVGPPFRRGRSRGGMAEPWIPDQEPEKLQPEIEEQAPEEPEIKVKDESTVHYEGEPEIKKAKFDHEPAPDAASRSKMPYPPYPRDPYDPYVDPYRRFPDPYYRGPYLDSPYGYDRLAYDRYGILPARYEPERKPFVPAESIDYGHGGVGLDKKSTQPAEVIDYGHGQAGEKSKPPPLLTILEMERAGLRSDNKSPNSSDAHRERTSKRDGNSEWPERNYIDADYRDRPSRDSDFRNRDSRKTYGSDSQSYGSGREDGRVAGYRSGTQPDEDLRFSRRGDPITEYKERLEGERKDYYSGRLASRENDNRERASTDHGKESLSSKIDERGAISREESRYSRRENPYESSEYMRLHDDDARGSRSFVRDEGLPPRDSYPRDPYSRDERDSYRPDRERFARPSSPAPGTPPTSASLSVQSEPEVVKVEDLLCPPLRSTRPPQIVVIIRGLPGSGKTYVSKLIREKETSYGGSAPRMLSLDDYFMAETDKEVIDPDTGKKVKKKVMEYEYEQALEESYRQSLLKSFKKTVDDGLFPFIILDATNERVSHFAEFWSYAKSKGFQVYVGELKVDVSTCIQRNIHHWTEWDVEKIKSKWEPLPCHYIKLDLRWILQDASIPEVVMEDSETVTKEEDGKKEEEDEEEPAQEGMYVQSKWELDTSGETLDKLDGIRVSKKHILEHQSMNEYLQLDQMDEEYNTRESVPGKKRVRWADLEEKKIQDRRRNLGFIVGQTQRDWDRITDDDFATKALNQTKYFYKS